MSYFLPQNKNVIKMLWLILCSLAFTASIEGCEITNITASEVTSTSVILTWASSNCPVKDYSITASHLKYKACPAHFVASEASEAILTFKGSKSQAFVQGLEPYSIYTFNISARIDKEAKLLKSDFQAETASARPQVKPLRGITVPQTQAIQFSWEDIPLETCTQQNGKFDGFYVELWGFT